MLCESRVSMSLGTVVLLLQRQGGAAQQRSLAARVGINAAAMVRVLDQGEAMGILARRDSPDNRRSKTVVLLPPGRTLARRLQKSPQALRKELLGDVPPRDIETALRVIRLFEARAQAFRAADKGDP